MNRATLKTAAIVATLSLGACSAQQQQQFSTVCTEIQLTQTNPTAAAAFAAQDPHSAIGVLWADAKSACANGAPAAGVSTDWGGMVWGEVKALAPTVIPILIGLL